jgi:hypothetical protein
LNKKDDDGDVVDINHEDGGNGDLGFHQVKDNVDNVDNVDDVDHGDLGFHQVEEALSKSGGQHLDCWSSDIDLRVF